MPSSSIGRFALTCVLCAAIVCACPLSAVSAHAVTAAEKQAEADAVYAQIDSLQTSLNGAIAEYNAARASYEQAIGLRDEASRKIEEETARLERLEGNLADYAVSMYKQGGSSTFIGVVLQAESFDDFLKSWDMFATISNRGLHLIQASREAREALQTAKTAYEQQSARASDEMAAAEAKQRQIAQTQAALAAEAAKLDAEAAELAAQEELAAEAARQAEIARQQREEMIANGQAGSSLLVGGGYFTNPCPDAYNSSGFGYRSFDNSFHKGLDMAAAEGTPYYAAESGTVMYATNDGGYNGGAGNWVVISHGNGIVTKYMHSSAVFVSPGQYVERGQNIGLVGQTGEAYGAHLHFQVEVDGVAVNPLNYI